MRRLAIGIGTMLMLAGCSFDAQDTVRTEVSIDKSEVGIHVDTTDALDVQSYSYGTFPLAEGMSYEMRGTYSVPEGAGPFPVVFLFHGNAETFDQHETLYRGLDYVTGHLAASGVLAISVDLHTAYRVEEPYGDERQRFNRIATETMKRIIDESKREGSPFFNKIHPKKVGVLGLSESGFYIFDVAHSFQYQNVSINALLSVTPKFVAHDVTWPTVDSSIIVAEYDKTIDTYDGYAMYDELTSEDNLKMVTLLRRANHNYFNDALETNDVAEYGSNYEIRHQMDREDQRQFMKQYAADYFLGVLNRTETSLLRILETKMQPDTMYWQDVLMRAELKGSVPLVETQPIEELDLNKVEVSTLIDARSKQLDETPLDTVFHKNGTVSQRTFYQIDWTKKVADVTFPSMRRNIVGKEVLAVNFIMDPSSERNKDYLYQPFSVELEDDKGNVARVKLPAELNATQLTEGGLQQEKDGQYRWSAYTPVTSVRIPLVKFVDIDYENITKVRLYFGETEEGTILLQSITVQ